MDIATELPWFQTLTLVERAALLADAHPVAPSSEAEDLERRWRAQPAFMDGDIFDQRLASDRLDPQTLRAAIGLRATDAGSLETPAWVHTLEAALIAGHSEEDIPLREIDRAFESVRLLPLVEPLIRHAFVRLRTLIARDLQNGPLSHHDANDVTKLLVPALPGRLVMLIRRPLILELNIARVLGTLDGDSPEQRFECFVHQIGQIDEQRRIFAEYPVMARQILIRIEQWIETSCEFVQHLIRDWEALNAIWSPASGHKDLGVLTKAKASLGDSHRGGRSVMRVAFDCGVRLIYKPRPLASEVHFNALLDWLNDHGFAPRLRTLTVLDRNDHGWVEMVETEGCSTPDEAERFYQRQGALTALLYALAANDMHYENVLASGEDPVIVDLETLFLPRITGQPAGSELTFMESMKRTVLASGLLPRPGRAMEGEGVSDLSGMTDIGGQKTFAPLLVAVDQGTDHMRFARRYEDVPDADNTPSIEGRGLVASDHTEAICQGFERAYRVMMRHRDALLASDGPIEAFADAEMRLVFRPTRVYANLLFESFHPDVLRDSLERDMFLDNLWLAMADGPFMAPLMQAEKHDLLNVDVPIFTARPKATTLHDSRGKEIDGIIADSGMAVVRQIIQGFDEDDLTRQLWLVRGTLATLDLATHGPANRPPLSLSLDRPALDNAATLATSDAIADQLATLAYSDERRTSWYAFEFLEHPHWTTQFADTGLYEGVSGIALFLAYHGALRNAPTSTRLARGAIQTLFKMLDEPGQADPRVGAFNGHGGIVYTLVHLSVLWDEPQLLDQAEQLVAGLKPAIADDEINDIVGGAAGCLIALLELARHRPTLVVLDAARACGDRIVENAKPQSIGLGWPLGAAGGHALAGFSHGVAGIAWALLRLHALVGDDRYRDVACQALTYERALFDPTERNWPDLRDGDRPEDSAGDGDHHFLVAWCHGAPGILLARLLTRPYLDDDPALQDEIEVALETTLNHGFEAGHCLCHGALGNLDILLVASDLLDRPDLAERARRLAGATLDHQAEEGWRYGVPGTLTPPGLMVGLAGFGHQLLRLAHPDRVPSVLALAPPPGIEQS